jgi:predicted house-cleaning noncanonical NTP pyrophosphatase (MazG superfamily)
MPPFFVLDDPHVLASISKGEVPPKLENDLIELTKRPLVLRTDGTKIPEDKREMLPRSEELRSSEKAKEWLLGFFKREVEKIGLPGASICLIGHHFIPSTASAWARAEPGNRLVRIESLWGLPDGLYWYSHDTFEVDTLQVALKPQKPGTPLHYKFWERPRFKGEFIAPDESGEWIRYQTAPPFDWRRSIGKKELFFEIAHITRLIAEAEKHPTAVMWFIGNHPQATPHSVLPWYHQESKLGEARKAAPRRKLAIATDFALHDSSDWQQLRANVAAGKRIERIIVEPTDCELIRNPEFVRDLADFAAGKKIVVELAGGVLSHAYYILHHKGAHVEFTDLFGAHEDVVEYYKLVRDKIPSIIEARGEKVEVIQLSEGALISALRQKLVEEAFEALDAKAFDDIVGELADVEEVIFALRRALRLGVDQIEAERKDKRRRRGGFDRGYMLRKTSTPHSIQKSPTASELKFGSGPREVPKVITQPADIPSPPTYRRPDLRVIEEEMEKLFVFETEIARADDLTEHANFVLPTEGSETREFALTVHLSRDRSSLRTGVRLRLRPSQAAMNLFQLKFDFLK